MAHHVYTTDALVLESAPGREADKSYILFTEELGKIRATAKGVRLLKSKLRYSLQDFSLITVSVVRGKEWWRITNAQTKTNFFQEKNGSKEMIHSLAQVFSLLKRLVPDEEKNENLFLILTKALDFFKTLNNENVLLFEYIVVLRILDNLGYLGKDNKLGYFVSADWDRELLVKMAESKKIAIAEINRSLKETQL